MKKFFIWTIIGLLLLTVNARLYAQDDPARADKLLTHIGELSLELEWQQELPEGIEECVLLDESGINIFSSQCARPAEALQEMRALVVTNDDIKLIKTDDFTVERETKISQYSKVSVSKNGKNFAVIEHVISGDIESGQWYRNVRKSKLRLFNSAHIQLAQIEFGPSPNAEIFAIGNDKTVVMTDAGEDGRYTNITVLVKQDSTFRISVALIGGLYPTSLFDYAENGSRIFLIHNDKPIDGMSNPGERIVLDGEGKELFRYSYQYQGYIGWVSPLGNYLLECLGGGNLVVRDKQGKLIVEERGHGGSFVGFSPDEKYFCLTPGPWRIYFFETETGKMLWQYLDTDKCTHFSSLVAITTHHTAFAGRSEAILTPSEFEGTIDEINRKVIENETKDRAVYVISNAKLMQVLEPFSGKGFETQLQAPILRLSNDEKFLLVTTPSKFFVYKILDGGGQ